MPADRGGRTNKRRSTVFKDYRTVNLLLALAILTGLTVLQITSAAAYYVPLKPGK